MAQSSQKPCLTAQAGRRDEFFNFIVRVRFSCFFYPRNQDICVHSEHTKHVAERLVQSRLKKVAIDVFSWALLIQNVVFSQIGHLS
jgi:hypothetical protein